MKNRELIGCFINGATAGRGSNLVINGDKLINYNTCIAKRVNGEILLNGQWYSTSTRRNQNSVRALGNNVIEFQTEEDFNEYVSNL